MKSVFPVGQVPVPDTREWREGQVVTFTNPYFAGKVDSGHIVSVDSRTGRMLTVDSHLAGEIQIDKEWILEK